MFRHILFMLWTTALGFHVIKLLSDPSYKTPAGVCPIKPGNKPKAEGAHVKKKKGGKTKGKDKGEKVEKVEKEIAKAHECAHSGTKTEYAACAPALYSDETVAGALNDMDNVVPAVVEHNIVVMLLWLIFGDETVGRDVFDEHDDPDTVPRHEIGLFLLRRICKEIAEATNNPAMVRPWTGVLFVAGVSSCCGTRQACWWW